MLSTQWGKNKKIKAPPFINSSSSPKKKSLCNHETLIHPNSIPWINPKNVSFSSSSVTSIGNSQLFVKCSVENGGNLKDVVSGLIDKRVEELLNKEENKGLLDGLTKANERVEFAKKQLDQTAQMNNSYVNHLEIRTSEIAECQREIQEAKAMVLEAERLLSNMDSDDILERKCGD